ncbi:hypothetical protein LTR95_009979 [Oleoguttula sp. CCFEE 5521]
MAKHEWMVILKDKPNSLAKRMEVRPEHLKNVLEQEKAGFWLLGGASLDEPVQEGQGPKINGSVMLALSETREEVIEKLKQDVYWTKGVWDVDGASRSSRDYKRQVVMILPPVWHTHPTFAHDSSFTAKTKEAAEAIDSSISAEDLDYMRGGGVHDGYWRNINYGAVHDVTRLKSMSRERRMHLPGKLPYTDLIARLARYDHVFLTYDACTIEELRSFTKLRAIPVLCARTRPRKADLIRLLHDADDRQTFTKLFDLSTEIRLLIYEFYIAHFFECTFRVDLTAPNPQSRIGIESAIFFTELESEYLARMKRLVVYVRGDDDAYLRDGYIAQIVLSRDSSRYEPSMSSYCDEMPLAALTVLERELRTLTEGMMSRGDSTGQLVVGDVYRLAWAMRRAWTHADLREYVIDDD